MHIYRAYGLILHSELEMAELEPLESGDPDLTIVFESLPHCIPPPPSLNYQLQSEPKWFVWKDLGRFELRGNCVLAVDREPGITDRYLTFAVLGPIIAYILHARERLVLHASAVCKDDKCIAFVAEKGTGKSTTAAAFVAAGFEPWCDDVTSLDIEASGIVVEPGFAQIKLRHDAASHIQPAALRMPEPRSGFEKAQYHYGVRPYRGACRLAGVYLLRRAAELSIRPLGEVEALTNLMAQAYISLYARRHAFVSAGERSRLMLQCAQVLRHTPVSVLSVPDGIDTIQRVVDAVSRDAALSSMAQA